MTATPPKPSPDAVDMKLMESRAANFLRRLNLPDIALNGVRLYATPRYASELMAEFAAQIQNEPLIAAGLADETAPTKEMEGTEVDLPRYEVMLRKAEASANPAKDAEKG